MAIPCLYMEEKGSEKPSCVWESSFCGWTLSPPSCRTSRWHGCCNVGLETKEENAKALFQMWQVSAGFVPSSPTECLLHPAGLRWEQLAEGAWKLLVTCLLGCVLVQNLGKGFAGNQDAVGG